MKHIIDSIKVLKIHELLFFVFLLFIPIQLRILYAPDLAYTDWYFNYHQAIFIYLTDLLLIVCFTSWILFDKSKDLLKSNIFRLILGIFGVIAIGLFHVKHLNLGLYETLKWAELLLIVVYVSHVYRTRIHYTYTATLLFITGVVQAIIGILQFHVQHGLGLTYLGEYVSQMGTEGLSTVSHETEKIIRAYGTMPHPNVLGGFLVVCLVFGIYLLGIRVEGSGQRKLVSRETFIELGLLLIILGIFVSFSRTAWLGTLIVLTCFTLYFWLRNHKRAFISTIAIIIVSCGTIGLFGYEYLVSRTINIEATSISGRADYNQMTLALVKRNLLLGSGPGDYVSSLKEMFHICPTSEQTGNCQLTQPWQYQPAHNIFLVLAGEFGLIMLAMFIWLLIYIAVKLKNVSQNEMLVFSCVVAGVTVILMGQLDHYFVTIQQGRLVFFVLIGLLGALPNLNKSYES